MLRRGVLACAALAASLALIAAGPARQAADEAPPAPPPKPAPSAPRTVLLVSGMDVPAHDWRSTTPVTRAALEEGGDVQVFVCEDPAILETDAILAYDAIVLNFRNPPTRDPGPKARAQLARYVKEGGGLAVLHFAVFAFAGWEDYAEIIGRVWVGRRSGEKISGHGPKGTFRVRVEDPDHPIAAGLADFEIDDELYAKLVGDAEIHVVLDAHSDWSGRDEPIAWTRKFGEGRVFVTVLGHDAAARENPGFRRLVRQGVEWAARSASE